AATHDHRRNPPAEPASIAEAPRHMCSIPTRRSCDLLKGDGVIVRNNGKLVTNNRTRRIDQIRTCFTLTENALAQAGERDMYVQVYNPQNELVGDQLAVQHEGGPMVYSAASRIYYENEELDVCILSNTDRDRLTAGTYKVYVYAGPNLIGTSSFDLR